MDFRTLSALGYTGNNFAPQQPQGLGQLFGGLPQPLTNGQNYTPNRNNAPIYSSAGLNQNVATPYTQTAGISRLNQNTAASPGSIDPALRATLGAGHAGWIDRGANAFLGGGFNPWTMENGGPEGSQIAPANQDQSLSQLFNTAASLGMDTSKYSRELGHMGIRGERSGTNDAMQLYDDLNNHARDYVSVGGLSQGWSGGPANTASRTIYKDVDGKLLPVTRPQFRGNNQDTGFFSNEFKDMMMTVGSAALGGWMAAPAAAGGTAAGSAAGAGAATNASALGGSLANSVGLGSQWAALPGWGQQAISGALRGGLSSALGGGNPLQGALSGGFTGGLGNSVNSAIGGMNLPSWASQGLSGAFTGGLGSALRGGNFMQGALGGGLGGIGGAVGRSIDPRLAGAGQMAGRSLASLFANRG